MDKLFLQVLLGHKPFDSIQVHCYSQLSRLFFKQSVHLVLQCGADDKSVFFWQNSVQRLREFVPEKHV